MTTPTSLDGKLDRVVRRHAELGDALARPAPIPPTSASSPRNTAISRRWWRASPSSRKAQSELADLEAILAGDDDPEMRGLAKSEIPVLKRAAARAGAAHQVDAAAEGRGGRAQRHPRGARRHRRRGGGAVRRGAVPHVSALRRDPRLALRGDGHLRHRPRRLQGGDRRDHRPQRVRAPQIRIRRASRPARAGDRGVGPHPHLGRHRRRAARGRGSRHPDRRQGSAHRRLSAPAGPAASRSTPPTARCASPICPPAWS